MSIKHVGFDNSATVAGTALTTSYVDLLALSDDADVLFVFNTSNVAIELSIPGGYNRVTKVMSYNNIRFPAFSSVAIDCRTNSKRIAKGTIQVRRVAGSSAATTGEVTITAVR